MKKLGIVYFAVIIGLCLFVARDYIIPEKQDAKIVYHTRKEEKTTELESDSPTEEDAVSAFDLTEGKPDEWTEDNTYTYIYSLAQRVEKELLGDEDTLVVYIKDISQDELKNINNYVGSIYGTAYEYSVEDTGEEFNKLTITLKRNINYCVYKVCNEGALMNGNTEDAYLLLGKVKGIINECIISDMNDFDKELALHDYIITHCIYKDGDFPQGDDVYTAYGALVNGEAVCNGYAEAFKLLLDCVGVESRVVAGTGNGINHAWNMVFINGEWYHVDLTWDDPIPDMGAENTNHIYFNVTDSMMSENHTWAGDYYPNANSLSDNYFVHTNRYYSELDDCMNYAYNEIVTKEKTEVEVMMDNHTLNESTIQYFFSDEASPEQLMWRVTEIGNKKILYITVPKTNLEEDDIQMDNQ